MALGFPLLLLVHGNLHEGPLMVLALVEQRCTLFSVKNNLIVNRESE